MKKNLNINKGNIRIMCLLLIAGIVLLTGCGSLKIPEDLDKVTENTANAVLEESPVITSGSIGGEFALKGLIESGVEFDPEIREDYYKTLVQVLKVKKGVLSEDQYTEYARATIGLLAIGRDPQNVEGYNFITPLDDYKIVNYQGINAESYAVLTARMAGVKLKNEDRYVKDMIKDIKRAHQEKLEDYSDYVSIELIGLSLIDPKNKEIEEAIELAKEYLSDCQKDDGSMGNSDATSIAIIGLIQVGVNVFEDEQFIKDGKTLADGLMIYYLEDGGFGYKGTEEYNPMSTESALLALDAIRKSMNNEKLYQ